MTEHKIFPCTNCGHESTTKQNLKVHMRSGNCEKIVSIVEKSRSDEKNIKVICSFCDEILDNKDSYRFHRVFSCSYSIEYDRVKLEAEFAEKNYRIEIRACHEKISKFEKAEQMRTAAVQTPGQSTVVVSQQPESLAAKAAEAANVVIVKPPTVVISYAERMKILAERSHVLGAAKRARALEIAAQQAKDIEAGIVTVEENKVEPEQIVETVAGQQYSTWFHSRLFADKFSACNLEQLEEEITKGREGLVNIFVNAVTRKDGKFMYVTDTTEKCKFSMNVGEGSWTLDKKDITLIEMFTTAYLEMRKTKNHRKKLIEKFPLHEKKIREFFRSLKTLNQITRDMIAKKCFDPSPFIW